MTLIMNTIEERIISLYIIKINSTRLSFVCPSVWLKSFLIFYVLLKNHAVGFNQIKHK